MHLCSLKFPLVSFPSEEYHRDISLEECSTATMKLLVPSIVYKISWKQTLIQNIVRETHKDFSAKQVSHTFLSSCTWELRNRYLSDLSWRKNRFPQESILSHANLPFWNACIEWACWELLSLYMVDFSHPYFLTGEFYSNIGLVYDSFHIFYGSFVQSFHNLLIYWQFLCLEHCRTCFGLVLCTETFKNGLKHPFPPTPFTIDKISWSWVNCS